MAHVWWASTFAGRFGITRLCLSLFRVLPPVSPSGLFQSNDVDGNLGQIFPLPDAVNRDVRVKQTTSGRGIGKFGFSHADLCSGYE